MVTNELLAIGMSKELRSVN